MKEKILNLLRAKFQGTHTLVLDRVADHLSQTVTDETQLETAISGVEPLVKSFAEILQSETDRRVTDAQKKAEEAFRKKHNLDENGKPIQGTPPAPTTPPAGGNPDVEVPAWAKGLMETVTKYAGTVESLAKKTSQSEKYSIAKAKLKAKGVLDADLEDYSKFMNLEIENLDEEADRISKIYNKSRQNNINKAVEEGTYTPVSGIESEDSMVKSIENWGKKFDTKN